MSCGKGSATCPLASWPSRARPGPAGRELGGGRRLIERLIRGELAGRGELASDRRAGVRHARRAVTGRHLAGGHLAGGPLLLAGPERAGLHGPALVRVAGRSLPLPRRAGKLGGRRVAGRSSGEGARTGKAGGSRVTRARDEAGTGPGASNAARPLARETVAVRPGTPPGPLVGAEPGTRTCLAGTSGARCPLERLLTERLLTERLLTVLLSRRRAAGEGALLRRRVVLVSLRRVPLRRSAVPRPGRPARGRACLRPAVAGHATALTGEIRCTVTGRRAASWSPREGRLPLRVGGSREPRSGPPAGTGSAALATVLPRASAAVWPGAGVGVRLPAPP